MSVRCAKTGLYRLHKPWLFSSGRARFSSKKYRNSFGKSPPPFHMQVAIQSNHLHVIIQSNHVRLMCWRCLRPNRSIGYLISPVSSSSRHRLRQSWLMFAVPQVTKTADLNMARIMKRSTSYRGFSAIPATFKLKENKQGPNLHLTETSHPPLFRNLFIMHPRPSNS